MEATRAPQSCVRPKESNGLYAGVFDALVWVIRSLAPLHHHTTRKAVGNKPKHRFDGQATKKGKPAMMFATLTKIKDEKTGKLRERTKVHAQP